MHRTDGVESCMGWGVMSCMEQVVWNRVWGWCARSCMEQMVWNRVWGEM